MSDIKSQTYEEKFVEYILKITKNNRAVAADLTKR